MSGENVSSQFTPALHVRVWDMSTSPIEILPCPTCEPLEFELAAGKPYVAIVGIKHLQPLAFTGIASGYTEGSIGSVSTTRLPTANLTPTGDGYDRYCSAFHETGITSAECTQRTTMRGVRYASFLSITASAVNSEAASAAGSTLAFKRSGTQVLGAPNLNSYIWSTSESPIP
jgi:hypothetical protein